ncbi:MAG: ribonuclease HII [Rhabdochlamydiaceae bacterium]
MNQPNLHDPFLFERSAQTKGFSLIAGIDEAGRGPLAGPVVASACILKNERCVIGIDDSKKLSSKERDSLYHQLTNHSDVIWAVGVVDNMVIDQINILQATFLAMKMALDALSVKPDFLLVDGSIDPQLGILTQTIVKGDSLSLSIGAASIIAKVTRDRLMQEYDKEFPLYAFGSHKGYGTKKHLEMIALHGACPIHRFSFSPLKEMI